MPFSDLPLSKQLTQACTIRVHVAALQAAQNALGGRI